MPNLFPFPSVDRASRSVYDELQKVQTGRESAKGLRTMQSSIKDGGLASAAVEDASNMEQTFAFSLLEHLVVPTYVLDTQCRVIVWNRACEELTCIPARDILGTSNHWRGFYQTPRPCLADLIVQGKTHDVQALYTECENATDSRPGLFVETWCFMPLRGTRLYLAANASPVYDRQGKLVAVIETMRDMTAHKQAQIALQEMAARDTLTGTSNRRTFDSSLQQEWSRAHREQSSLALLMIDVDRFKQFNDTYGHVRGDECLQQVARVVSESLFRPSDLIARYGGEEFAAILPYTSIQDAYAVAERIRSRLEQCSIPHANGENGVVTVSIGVTAVIPPRSVPSDPKQLVGIADAALYEAKEQGRNRVICKAVAG